MASEMKNRGIFVVGFSSQVLPRGEARIRVQISTVHAREHLDRALTAFEAVGKGLAVI